MGYCYLDSVGVFHVVEDAATAFQYTKGGVYPFPFAHKGGYPLDDSGEELIIYTFPLLKERNGRTIPVQILNIVQSLMC